jgi:hypothetical protein
VIFGDAYLDAVTTHLIHAGGKRLRPLLALASATGGEREATREDLLGGVSLELMHLASLYHDDVMDEAEIRRNVDSVNARYGNLVAIVAGDYLMARSAGIAADLGAESASLMARTLAWLTRGQVSEVRTAFSLARTETDYFEAIEGKTATLMSSSCRMGAMTANSLRENRSLDRVRSLLRHGLPVARRHLGLDRDRQPTRQARRSGPRRGHLQPCPRSSRCATPTWAKSCAAARTTARRRRARARAQARRRDRRHRANDRGGHETLPRRRPRVALGATRARELRVGFTSFIGSLLEDLPGY